MANTVDFTNLAPILYRSMDIVAREQIGAITSAMLNTSGVDRASQGDKVQSLRTSEPVDIASYVVSMAVPEGGDKTNVYDEFAISQYVGKELPIKGEVARKLSNIGDYGKWIQDEFAQIFRSIYNEIEAYACGIIYKGASRAYGTAGTNPFATTINSLAQARKILKDNGCPVNSGELSAIFDTTAGAALLSLAQLQKVNESGATDVLRQGTFGSLMGFLLKESAGIQTHTAGTASSSTTNNAGYAVGATTLTLASAGTGTFVVGDAVTVGGGTDKYVLSAGDADVSGGGTIVLNRPGLRVAQSAATKALAQSAAYTANFAFHRNAVEIAMRAPAMPPGGDLAVDRMIMQDPIIGLPLEFRLYKGHGMNKIEVDVIYDAKVWKPEFVVNILG